MLTRVTGVNQPHCEDGGKEQRQVTCLKTWVAELELEPWWFGTKG